MTLRCKPGDLAVVINADYCKENIGLIVHVLRPAVAGDRLDTGSVVAWEVGNDSWVVQVAGAGTLNAQMALGFKIKTKQSICRDSNLRPIRDPGEDAQDETLTWLPSPSRERTVA